MANCLCAATKASLALRGLSTCVAPSIKLGAAPSAASPFRTPKSLPLRALSIQAQGVSAQHQAGGEGAHTNPAPAETETGKSEQHSLESTPVQSQQPLAYESALRGPRFSDLLSPWFPGDRSLRQMLTTVDRMFDDMLSPSFAPLPRIPLAPLHQRHVAVRPPWGVEEDETAYHLRFDLPGMGKEDVSVKVTEDHTLVISAEQKEGETQGEGGEGGVPTRLGRRFLTTLKLPEEIERGGVKAEMKNGVLSISVPKKEPRQEQVFQVPVA